MTFLLAVILGGALWGPHIDRIVQPSGVRTVLWSRGDVRVSGPGHDPGDPLLPAAVGDELVPGSTLEVAAGAELWALVGPPTILWRGVGPVRLSVTDAGLEAAATPDDEAGMVERVWLLPWTAEPPLAPERTLIEPPEAPSVAVLSPRYTGLTERSPTLEWRGPSDGRFTLTLHQRTPVGELELVERWSGLATTSHAVDSALARGGWFRWQVSDQRRPEQGDQSWFYVLSAAELEASRGALAVVELLRRAPDLVPPPAGAALRATVLELHGRLAEAEEVWAAAATVWPDEVGLLRQVERLHRRQLGPPRPVWRLRLPFGVIVEL